MTSETGVALATMVTAALGLLAGLVSVTLALLSSRKVEQVHLLVNSKLEEWKKIQDELMASREINAEARGHAAGLAEREGSHETH